MSFGIIEYNEDGKPKCEICCKYFNRVLPHVRQKHDLNEKEYKLKFGFDLYKGICSEKSSNLSREKTLLNYDKCIKNNLLKKGSLNRFIINHQGRTKDKVSPQTRIRLKERLKTPHMIESMKQNGKIVGDSGLGNKKRWERKIKNT
jgi:hypothetical protein